MNFASLGKRLYFLVPVKVALCSVFIICFCLSYCCVVLQCFDAVGWVAGKGIRPIKTEQWGAGMVICLVQGADLHMAHLMPLPLTVSCFSKIQTGFTFLVPAHPSSPGQRAVKWVCMCVTAV